MEKSRSVTPLTIKQFLNIKRAHTEAPFTLDERIIDWVKIIGLVTDVEENKSYYKLQVGDGLSGGVAAFVWRRAEHTEALQLLSGDIDLKQKYVRIYATLSGNGKFPLITIESLKIFGPESNFHEVFCHDLECIFTMATVAAKHTVPSPHAEHPLESGITSTPDGTPDSMTVASSARELEDCSVSELDLADEDRDSIVYLPADRSPYPPPAMTASGDEEGGSVVGSVADEEESKEDDTPGKADSVCPRFTAVERGIVASIVEHKDSSPTGSSVSEIVHFLLAEGIPFSPDEFADSLDSLMDEEVISCTKDGLHYDVCMLLLIQDPETESAL